MSTWLPTAVQNAVGETHFFPNPPGTPRCAAQLWDGEELGEQTGLSEGFKGAWILLIALWIHQKAPQQDATCASHADS